MKKFTLFLSFFMFFCQKTDAYTLNSFTTEDSSKETYNPQLSNDELKKITNKLNKIDPKFTEFTKTFSIESLGVVLSSDSEKINFMIQWSGQSYFPIYMELLKKIKENNEPTTEDNLSKNEPHDNAQPELPAHTNPEETPKQ